MDDLKSQDLESQDWERLDWESLFSPRILVRGMGYYESGAVTELSRTEGGYRALVELSLIHISVGNHTLPRRTYSFAVFSVAQMV